MKLMRIGMPGDETPAVLGEDGTAFDLSTLTTDIDGPFLASGGIDRVRRALAGGELPRLDVTGRRTGAPVARPGKVVCVGLNYRDHAEETGAPVPERPVVFMKDPSTVVGPYDDVLIPVGRSRPTGRSSSRSSSPGRPAIWRARRRRPATSPGTPSATTSPSGSSSWSSPPSGTSASPARPSTRSAPGS